MDRYGYLALWCAVFGAAALVGYGRSLTGTSGAQRAVRVMGRIERVREPRHGGSPGDGIPVVVSFHDPSSGREFTVTNDGDRGDTVTAAWVGREIGVRYPPGRPHAFRFADDPDENRRGLARPNLAVLLAYVGVVVVVSVDRGRPWALLGAGVPWTVLILCHLPGNIRETRRRLARLAAMASVPGRVVAVLKRAGTDGDGNTFTTLVPVVAFTTREDTAVLACCPTGLPDPGDARGRDVTVHYAPDDPAVLTMDPAAQLRAARLDFVLNAVALALGTCLVVAGALAL
ncbi:DUF3592 domain-containing protein [Streptomyces griseoviridis]|uniref:DUF3592 domain-containing protein n=1 Tax=Streptomyces griseoviridis TaxID=45398 RepID=UPI00340F9057